MKRKKQGQPECTGLCSMCGKDHWHCVCLSDAFNLVLKQIRTMNCKEDMAHSSSTSKKAKTSRLQQPAVSSSSSNHKAIGRRYNYIHSMDSRLYVTLCANCGEEVGGWTQAEADERWSSHCC
jgi:hypothetical protein